MQIEYTDTLVFDGGWDTALVRRTLTQARHIVLVAHTNADGDAVGSLTGMAALLRAATQASVVMMLPDGCPDDLTWLPSTTDILCGRQQSDLCRQAITDADMLIGLDISSWQRTGCLEADLRASTAYKMLVDHHIDPERGAFNLVVSEPSLSSTCELVYWLMHTTFGDSCFGALAATSLYTGICTDTGTFSFSNSRPSVYAAAASLLRFGIDPADINRRIKNTFTEARLRFFGFAIAHRLQVFTDQGVALMTLTADDMASHGVQSHELTGLINEVMRLKDIDCGILVREEDGQVRLSLRSKEHHDVNQLVSELFGGGGHKRAAGATSHLSLSDTVALVRRRLALCLLPLLAIVATSCRQVPVVDPPSDNQEQLRQIVINANRHVAHSEEQQIVSYLERRGLADAPRLDGGVRVVETSTGSGRPVRPGDTLYIGYRLEDLGGEVIYDYVEQTVVAGQQRPTPGLDAALLTLHHGSQAMVLVPSAMGFGVAGDADRIPGRTVLVYKDLEIPVLVQRPQ